MHSTHIKLASISRQLSEIGAKIKSALQQATGGTPTPIGPRPLSGPGSRLTESENQDLLRMFKRVSDDHGDRLAIVVDEIVLQQ